MKKYNEGYTLVLVLVVIFVLFTISLAITSFSLNNLKNQLAMADRMEAKYEAMGALEIALAQLEKNCEIEYTPEDKTEDDNTSKKTVIEQWIAGAEGAVDGEINLSGDECTFSALFHKIGPNTDYPYTIDCAVNISVKIEVGEKENITKKATYTISEISVEYTSYEIGGAES